jgi:glycosyltransferase involved in cell wall biosynthesis
VPTIAYIAGLFPLRSETFVWREVRELRRRGWDVVCVSLNKPPESLAGFEDLERGRLIVYDGLGGLLARAFADDLRHPIRALSADSRAWADVVAPGERKSPKDRAKIVMQQRAAASLAKKLRPLGVSHIHCHFAHAPATIGMYAAARLGVPFSFTGHANDLFQRRSLLKRKLQRAAFVSCISEEHRRLYRSIVDRDDASYPVIRCGVDVGEFAPRTPPNNDPPRVLTVARLVEKKSIDTLVRGLPDGWRLTVAGDGPMMAELKSLADQRTTFLGAVDNARVTQLLAEHDAFALPCRVDRNGDKDGIPVVLMEAMAAGVPVVSGDLPAIRELVRHDATGLLVDGTKPDDVRAALSRLSDAALRSTLGAAGRQRVVEEFSLSVNLDRLEAQFRRAAE